MLRDVQNQYGSNLPTPFFLDFEKPHGFLAYALLSVKTDPGPQIRLVGTIVQSWVSSFHTYQNK